MKHIKLFEAYIRNIQESTDSLTVAKENFLTSGQFEFPLDLDKDYLSYSNGLVAQKIVEMTKKVKTWKIEFEIPKVASYELLPSGINITPIGNLRTNDLPKDSGTNFSNSIIGPNWWKKSTKSDIDFILGKITGYCVKAAYTDYVNVNLEVTYNQYTGGGSAPWWAYYTPKEIPHKFDPSLYTGDLLNWIVNSTDGIRIRATEVIKNNEVLLTINKIASKLPKEIDIKVSWEI